MQLCLVTNASFHFEMPVKYKAVLRECLRNWSWMNRSVSYLFSAAIAPVDGGRLFKYVSFSFLLQQTEYILI